ncbi:PREDICTED: uncharacterized protein LOC107170331 [Diuraphis noxia]|uniref:uncharacterized protein LOC107170331 n=1 Tax=Diuraphis noxia TaxID=143948 RepID=UPI0007639EC3|nr:PREDICTED: uncharacterized protein LOC107170331 [Diuraphis noxia]
MSCQQLTSVCIFIITCQIAYGQLNPPFNILSLLTGNRSLQNLKPPPPGYHYEPLEYVYVNYPSNRFTIQFGRSNIVNKRNNGGRKKNKKSKNSDDFNTNDPQETGTADDTPPENTD